MIGSVLIEKSLVVGSYGHVDSFVVIVILAWLLANYKWWNSLKSIRPIHLISRAKILELLSLSQTLSKISQNFSSETKDSANMDKRTKEGNQKEMRKPEIIYWIKSTGQWNSGGTGFIKSVAPVSISRTRIYPWLTPSLLLFTPLLPHDSAQ